MRILSLTLLLLLSITAAQAQETMQAPFSDKVETKSPRSELFYLKEKAEAEDEKQFRDLAYPHRPSSFVGEQLRKAVSEALTLRRDNYEDHLKFLAKHMDSYALDEYKSFIADNNFIALLQKNRWRADTIVRETPLLLKKGNYDGRYRWLFKVPVTMTLMPENAESYGGFQPVIKNFDLEIQVGRVADKKGNAIKVEGWTAVN